MNAYRLIVRMADNEWGNELMRVAAREAFAAYPNVEPMVVEVIEHAGWHLTFLRDGTVIGTANDMATTHLKALRAFHELTREAEWKGLPGIHRVPSPPTPA